MIYPLCLRFGIGIFPLAALVAACAGPQASTIPSGASLSELKASATSHNRKPQLASASGKDLVYVSSTSCASYCDSEVDVYTFPEGALVGTWPSSESVTGGECSDGAGDAFVTYESFITHFSNLGGEILKFAHGSTTPVATLSAGFADPVACSVDPKSGNLAVVTNDSGYTGALLIYGKASESPTAYYYAGASFYGVTYDDRGNVFVDGLTAQPSSNFVVTELPKGGDSFRNVRLKTQPGGAGQLDWDGRLTMGLGSYIWRFNIVGDTGVLHDIIELRHLRGGIVQYAIAGKQVVVAYEWRPCKAICNLEGTVGVWKYPSGHAMMKHILSVPMLPTGVALSPSQNRH